MKTQHLKGQDKLIETFINNVRKEFGGKLKKIILFGSRARGDHFEDSDYDFILIFDAVTKDIKDRLHEIKADMLLKYDMVITAIPYTDEDVEKRRGCVVKKEVGNVDTKVMIEKGKRALEDSKILFADRRYESASSRAYYSVFHLMQAALLTDGLSFSKHF